MKVGVTLPQFQEDAETAIVAALRAEELGLDGVFVFDHLWPIGQPDKPVLPALPLLGALAAETERVRLATLEARVGLVPDAVLVHELASLARMAPGRFIAGLGTGDRMSAAENLAFGVDYPPAPARREALRWCCRQLRALGIPTWVGIGAGARETRAVAVEEGVAVNYWEAPVAAVASETEAEATWAGPLPGGVGALAESLKELAEAGATWTVCAWPSSLEVVAEAAAEVRAL